MVHLMVPFTFAWYILWNKYSKGVIMKKLDEKNVKFYLRNRGNITYIRAVISFDRKQVEVFPGVHVDPKKLIEGMPGGMVKAKANTIHRHNGETISAKEFDQLIESCATKLSNSYNRAFQENNGKFPDPKRVKELFYKEDKTLTIKPEGSNSFLFFWDAFTADGNAGKIEHDGGKEPAPWSPETLRKYGNAKWHLESFNKGLLLKDFSISVLNDFVSYLVKANLQNPTIEKIYKCTKVYIKWLANKEYIDPEIKKELRSFRLGLKKISEKQALLQNNIALTYDELMKVHKHKIPKEKEYLKRTRDVFVFQCLTGLRYSDLEQLTKNHLQPDKGKHGSIEFFSVKGQKKILVPLNSIARNIANRYQRSKGEKLLPVISNQKYNTYLKELGKAAELKEWTRQISFRGTKQTTLEGPKHEFITSHVARKTFINIGFDLGLRPEIVATIVGASLPVIMKHYRAVKDQDLFKAMQVFK